MREIMGYQYVDMVDREGKIVKGYKLYLRYVDDNVTGDACESVWVPEGKYPPGFDCGIGSFLYVLRSAKGKVQGIIPCAA